MHLVTQLLLHVPDNLMQMSAKSLALEICGEHSLPVIHTDNDDRLPDVDRTLHNWASIVPNRPSNAM